MEWIPESVAWLDSADQLRPRAYEVLREEACHRRAPQEATPLQPQTGRVRSADASCFGLRWRVTWIAAHQRRAESLVTRRQRAVIDASIRLHEPDRDYEFAVLSDGTYGGSEIGFGSDIDVLSSCRT